MEGGSLHPLVFLQLPGSTANIRRTLTASSPDARNAARDIMLSYLIASSSNSLSIV